MRSRQGIMALTAVCIVLVTAKAAGAAVINIFDGSSPGAPNVDIEISGLNGTSISTSTVAGGTLQPGGAGQSFVETISLGTIDGPGTLIGDAALILPGSEQMTGGGKGVADILRVLSFGSGTGLEVIYTSNENGFGLANPGFSTTNKVTNTGEFCQQTPTDGPPCPVGKATNEFVEEPSLVTLFDQTVTLPAPNGTLELIVAVSVPAPPGLPLFAAGLLALAGLRHRRLRAD
jgi:hypothetical protein